MSRRVSNWPLLLDAFIESRRHVPFEWGRNDCCSFACDAVHVLTGITIGRRFRSQYDDAKSAVRLLKESGGVLGIATDEFALYGFRPLLTVLLAQRGDVVVLDTPEHGPALGVCLGQKAVFPGPSGLTFDSIANCYRGWRID